MSREGTIIKPKNQTLYFDVNINSVEQADSLYEELNRKYDKIEAEISELVLATPKDITPKGEAPIDYIKERLDGIFEELHEIARDFYTVDVIRNIIEEWRYSYGEGYKQIYNECKTNEEVNKLAFPEDKHIEVKRDLSKFTFAPPDDHIINTLTRSIKSIQLNDELSEFIMDKYVIIQNKKLYVDYDGQFLFSSEENAVKAIKEKMDFHAIDYISKEFITQHPNYFNSVINEMQSKMTVSLEERQTFEQGIMVLEEGNLYTNHETLENIYKIFNDFVINEVFKILDVEIVKFKDLIQKEM